MQAYAQNCQICKSMQNKFANFKIQTFLIKFMSYIGINQIALKAYVKLLTPEIYI